MTRKRFGVVQNERVGRLRRGWGACAAGGHLVKPR